jgi:hypothetical protein
MFYKKTEIMEKSLTIFLKLTLLCIFPYYSLIEYISTSFCTYYNMTKFYLLTLFVFKCNYENIGQSIFRCKSLEFSNKVIQHVLYSVNYLRKKMIDLCFEKLDNMLNFIQSN